MDFLQLISNTDILCYIVSYLWIKDWRSLAMANKRIYNLFRHKVNKAIYDTLYSAICFKVRIIVPNLGRKQDADYFGLEFVPDCPDGFSSHVDEYYGVIVGRSGEVIYQLRRLCAFYRNYLGFELEHPYADLLILDGTRYEPDNTDPIDLELNFRLICGDYDENIAYSLAAGTLVPYDKYDLWEGGRLCDQLITQVRAKEDAPLFDIHNLYE